MNDDREEYVWPGPPKALALREGEKRQAWVEETGSNERLDTTTREAECRENAVGFAGEYAYATRFGLKVPDWTERRGGDPGYDFLTPLGSIDIKSLVAGARFIPLRREQHEKPECAKYFWMMRVDLDRGLVYPSIWAVHLDIVTFGTYYKRNCYEPYGKRTDWIKPGWALDRDTGKCHQPGRLERRLRAAYLAVNPPIVAAFPAVATGDLDWTQVFGGRR